MWLSPGATGRGLIGKAAAHMIDWAVTERGMSRVEWKCAIDNKPSKAVAERLGFAYEGTSRSAFPVRGERVDVGTWALLAEEWTARPR